jgi:hypothetical protein
LTSKYFLINWVVCILLIEHGLKSVTPLYAKKAGDKERDEKFYAFKRNDLSRIHRPVLYLFAPWMLIRWVSGLTVWAVLSLTTQLILIGHKPEDPLTGFKKAFIRFTVGGSGKILLMLFGCYWVDIENKYADYEEYLGPDWKKDGVDFDKCGSTVVNH